MVRTEPYKPESQGLYLHTRTHVLLLNNLLNTKQSLFTLVPLNSHIRFNNEVVLFSKLSRKWGNSIWLWAGVSILVQFLLWFPYSLRSSTLWVTISFKTVNKLVVGVLVSRPHPIARKRVWYSLKDFWGLLTQYIVLAVFWPTNQRVAYFVYQLFLIQV